MKALIELTDREQQLFEFLSTLTTKPLRAAGGWVRDKFMGCASDDIDISVEGMSGAELAEMAEQRYFENTGEIHSVGVIKINPEKSKHLETATTRILGFQVDFVELRKEKYVSDSRVPVIESASPEEDAFRRDFTVNSLFFNLSTQRIEDYTGRGITDIKRRVIDTPLDPEETLSQDPLRIVRAVRFAARLGFSLSERLEQAISTATVIDRMSIVSRSRYQQEIVKCFTRNVVGGVLQLSAHDLLFRQVFMSLFEPFCEKMAAITAKTACDRSRDFALAFYGGDAQISSAISKVRTECPDFESTVDVNVLRAVLGFLAISHQFQFEMRVPIDVAEQPQSAPQIAASHRMIEDTASYLVPFLACAQGKNVSTTCKEMSELLEIENDVELVLALFQVEHEAVMGLFVLNAAAGGAFEGRLSNIFTKYTRGAGILQCKPNVPDLRIIAEEENVTDKRLYAELKREIVVYWLSSPDYPEFDRELTKFHFAHPK